MFEIVASSSFHIGRRLVQKGEVLGQYEGEGRANLMVREIMGWRTYLCQVRAVKA